MSGLVNRLGGKVTRSRGPVRGTIPQWVDVFVRDSEKASSQAAHVTVTDVKIRVGQSSDVSRRVTEKRGQRVDDW